MKLVLPEEEAKVPMEEEEKVTEQEAHISDCILQDASTQTPKQKLRRRGGRESRTRRLLAFQAMLTVKRGLPMSRLLSEKKTDARSSKEDFLKLQEESASPALKMRKEKEKVVKKEKNMEVVKEKEYCPREGVSSSGSPIFTLRNSQTGASTPPPKPETPWPDAPPFPPSTSLHLALASSQSNSTLLRDACCKLGILWRLPLLGPSVANLGRSIVEAGKLFDTCLHSQ